MARRAAPLPVAQGSVKELKDKITALGGQGFHFRVKKKNPDKSFGYTGKIDADVDDIEETLKTQYGEGYYRLYAHFNNGKMIREIPPQDFGIGNPESWKTDDGKQVTAVSSRLKDIDEEIQAKRKQKELMRAERELRRFEEETLGNNEVAGPDPMMEVRLEQMESLVERLTAQNQQLVEEKKQKAMEDRIANMQKSFEDKFQALLDTKRPNEEAELLKAQIEKMRVEQMQREFEAKLEAISAQNQKPAFGLAEVVQITAPFVPVLTTLVTSRQNSTLQMIDAVTKVGSLLKDSMPKGLDFDKLLSAAPLIAKLIPKGPDMSGMFDMVGSMVGPLLEAAASGGGGSDDMGSIVKQVLGTVQKAMSGSRGGSQPGVGQFRPQIPYGQGGQGVMAPRPTGVAPQPMMRPAAPKPSAQPKKTYKIPIVGFADQLSQAIKARNEDFTRWANVAERMLQPDEVEKLSSLRDGSELATFLSGQPGVDSIYLTTSYGRRWLGSFLKELNRGAEGEPTFASDPIETPESVIPPVLVKEPEISEPEIIVPVAIPIPDQPGISEDSAMASLLGTEVHLKPTTSAIAKIDVLPQETEKERMIRLPHDVSYPEDSKIEKISGYGTPSGLVTLTVERPSEKVIAEREAERREAVAKFQNPPEARIKFRKEDVPSLAPIPEEDQGLIAPPIPVDKPKPVSSRAKKTKTVGSRTKKKKAETAASA